MASRQRGMFAARMWGIQFAVICAGLSACQSSPEALASSGTGCGSTAAFALSQVTSGHAGASIKVGIANPHSMGAMIDENVAALSPEAQNDVGRRMTAVSDAIAAKAQADGRSVDDALLTVRVTIASLGSVRPDLAAKPDYKRMIDSVMQLPGVAAEVEQENTMVEQSNARRTFAATHPNSASYMTSSDTTHAVDGVLSIGDAAADTTVTTWYALANVASALSTSLSSFTPDSDFSAGLTNTAVISDSTVTVMGESLNSMWLDSGYVPTASRSHSTVGCSEGVTIASGQPAHVISCPWCPAAIYTVVKFVAKQVAKNIVNARTTTITEVEEVASTTLSEQGVALAGDIAEAAFDFFVIGPLLFDRSHGTSQPGATD